MKDKGDIKNDMTVIELNAKACMAHLLLGSAFHHFSFIEGEVTTFNRFQVDGRLYKDFFDEKPDAEYALWKDVQQYFLSIMKGKRTPLNFKIILSLSSGDFEQFLKEHDLSFRPEEIQGLYLNLRYDGSCLQCITGTSMNTFTMDKTLEPAWDLYVQKFFGQLEEAT